MRLLVFPFPFTIYARYIHINAKTWVRGGSDILVVVCKSVGNYKNGSGSPVVHNTYRTYYIYLINEIYSSIAKVLLYIISYTPIEIIKCIGDVFTFYRIDIHIES